MPNLSKLEAAIPVAPLKLIVMDSARNLGNSVNHYLVNFRKDVKNIAKNDPAFQGYVSDNFIADAACHRFGSGEGKATIDESIRGKDIFILVDVCNHNITYKMNGFINYKSPDDHYQDLKRVISAINGKAHRINVIMPFLYEGRQHKRNGRESLDCAYAIEELSNMGVSNFITFDAHDPRVQNAEPLCGFDNFTPPYQFIRALLGSEQNLIIDKDHLIVISPDEGALDRAVYFANVLGVDTGMFYKRRDYSTMLDTAKQLKAMNAKRVYICCTFGLFTDGLDRFDEAYEKCYFDKVVTTNLTYQLPELKSKPYYLEADMSKFRASIIDFMNHDSSMMNVYTPTEKIQEILAKYNNRENMYITE